MVHSERKHKKNRKNIDLCVPQSCRNNNSSSSAHRGPPLGIDY